MHDRRGGIAGNGGRMLSHFLEVADGRVDDVGSIARSLLSLTLQLMELVE